MRHLLVILAVALALGSSLAACDLPGQQTNKNFQQVGNGLNK